MTGKYLKKGYFHFILLNSLKNPYEKAEQIAKNAFFSFPDRFKGARNYFPFQLRYIHPFESFSELKRLQGMAAEKARFCDEYRGYIAIDLSSYLGHESERYFDISLKYFYDMKDCWSYIFLVENRDQTKLRELLRKIYRIFDDTPISIIEEADENVSVESFIKKECKKANINFSPSAFSFLQKVVKQEKCLFEVLPVILRDISTDDGARCVLGMDKMNEIFFQRPITKYMLSPRQIDNIKKISEESISEKQKEGMEYEALSG